MMMKWTEWRSQSGQGLMEYVLIILLVGVVVGGTAYALGPSIGQVYSALQGELAGGQGSPPGSPPVTATPAPTPTPTPTPQPADWGGWQVATGNKWRVEGDSYCTGPGGEQRSFYGAENWTDYEITFKALLTQGNGYGVYFRATNYQKVNAYIFQYDPGYGKGAFLYRRIVDGNEQSPFARTWAPDGYAWHDEEREIRVRVEGNIFTAYVDGEVVLQAQHSEYTHGGVGLRAWDGSNVCFRDFQIHFLRPPERGRDDPGEIENIQDERIRQ